MRQVPQVTRPISSTPPQVSPRDIPSPTPLPSFDGTSRGHLPRLTPPSPHPPPPCALRTRQQSSSVPSDPLRHPRSFPAPPAARHGSAPLPPSSPFAPSTSSPSVSPPPVYALVRPASVARYTPSPKVPPPPHHTRLRQRVNSFPRDGQHPTAHLAPSYRLGPPSRILFQSLCVPSLKKRAKEQLSPSAELADGARCCGGIGY